MTEITSSPMHLIKIFRDTMTHGVTDRVDSDWKQFSAEFDEYVPFVVNHAELPDIADINWDGKTGKFELATSVISIRLPYEKCLFIFGNIVVAACETEFHELEIYGFIAKERRAFTSLLNFHLKFPALGMEAQAKSRRGKCEGNLAKGNEELAHSVLKWVLGTVALLDAKDTRIELEEYPAAVQKSRRKHHKPLLPAIRRIRPGSIHVSWGGEGSHSPKCPHDRRGHWATLRDGRKIWKRQCKIKGGGGAPPMYAVEPATLTVWENGQ